MSMRYWVSLVSTWWSQSCLVLCSKSAFLPAYSRMSASLLSFSVIFFFTLLRSTCVYPVLTRKNFSLHRGRNAKEAHFRHPTGPAHPSRPRTSLQFCRIMSPTQKISVFHHNQTDVSTRSHLLSSKGTLRTIPLLSRKSTRGHVPQSTWSRNHTDSYYIRNQLRTQRAFGWNSNRQASLSYIPTTRRHSTTAGPQRHSP